MTDYKLPTIDLFNDEVLSEGAYKKKCDKSTVAPIRMILNSLQDREGVMDLPIAIGATVSNEPFMVDLRKMRHLLVGGASGTGKSVCLHTILTSLFFNELPSKLKLVLIDPKHCELDIYQKLENHYLAKLPGDDESVVTSADKAVVVLSSLCLEMEERFMRLKAANVRNLKDYNKVIRESIANSDEGNHEMPYIVVVIDEYSDLVAAKGNMVEDYIIRLAQRGHVAGIHIILSTQRISCDFITGKLKANFPSRIAFRVFSGADSRTLIDREGAELLKVYGDMLFYINGQIERVQGVFIDSSEIERLCDFISRQLAPTGPYLLPKLNHKHCD